MWWVELCEVGLSAPTLRARCCFTLSLCAIVFVQLVPTSTLPVLFTIVQLTVTVTLSAHVRWTPVLSSVCCAVCLYFPLSDIQPPVSFPTSPGAVRCVGNGWLSSVFIVYSRVFTTLPLSSPSPPFPRCPPPAPLQPRRRGGAPAPQQSRRSLCKRRVAQQSVT